MKKIIVIALVLLFTTAIQNANAQNGRTETGTDIAKEKEAKSKLPDLEITGVKVSAAHNVGSSGLMRTITYTVKNNGAKALSQSLILVEGFLANTEVYNTEIVQHACGSIVSPIGTMLNPGQSATSSFNCSDRNLFNRYRFYILYVDLANSIAELNENNNQKSTLIN